MKNFYKKTIFWIGIISVCVAIVDVCNENFLDSFYESLRLITANHQFEDGDKLDKYCIVRFFRFPLLALFLLFTFRLFLAILAPKWWQIIKQYFPCSERYLFVGAGEQAKILANNLKGKGCRSIFLVSKKEENNNALFEELIDIGAIVLYVNFEDGIKFPRKINKFFFVEEDENFNMEMSDRLFEQLKHKISKKEINIYVKTESEQFYFYIENQLKENHENCKNIEFRIFNQSDLTARLFIKENPMLKSPNIEIDHKKLLVKGEFNVLFLGFGWQGQELLKKCVCDSQFLGSTFKATIIDRDFETHYGDYFVLFDECIKHYNLQFKSETIGSKAFYEWINVEICKFNRIIIALGNDNINIDIAEKITKILHKQGKFDTQNIIFARVQQLESYSCNFTTFGKLTDIYTKDIIVNEIEDEIAKMVNYVYIRDDEPLFKEFTKTDRENIIGEWKKTSLFNKDSSRAVARNIENLMKIADKNILELNDEELNAEELNIIAENEHLRWNAFHFVMGICEWKLDEINTENAKFKDNHGNLLKHGCLVPFSELDNVSAKVNEIKEQQGKIGNEDYVKKDRRIVRHFPLFLKEVRLKNKNQ